MGGWREGGRGVSAIKELQWKPLITQPWLNQNEGLSEWSDYVEAEYEDSSNEILNVITAENCNGSSYVRKGLSIPWTSHNSQCKILNRSIHNSFAHLLEYKTFSRKYLVRFTYISMLEWTIKLILAYLFMGLQTYLLNLKHSQLVRNA